MALATNHPTLKEQRFPVKTASIGTTPVACYAAVPFRGFLKRFVAITDGAITTADCTVTVAVNGTTVGTFTIPVAGAAAGQIASGAPSTVALSAVNEDDSISFTPSGASGASIPCTFHTTIWAG